MRIVTKDHAHALQNEELARGQEAFERLAAAISRGSVTSDDRPPTRALIKEY